MNDTKQNLLLLIAVPQTPALASKKSGLRLHVDVCERDHET